VPLDSEIWDNATTDSPTGTHRVKDRYPAYPSIDPSWLVPPEDQPEYLDLPGRRLAPDANLAAAILATAPPDAPAVIRHETGQVLTYSDLGRESARIAGAMAGLGVEPGDRVAFRSGNRPEAILVTLAAWRLGAVVVPTPPQARAAELRFFLDDTRPRLLVAQAGLAGEVAPALQGSSVQHVLTFGEGGPAGFEDLDALAATAPAALPERDIDADSLAIIWHTGGTTGTPKGCYHTQRRFLLGGYAFGEATGAGPGQRWAAGAPIGHALGFISYTNFTLLNGATVVTIEDFSRPEVVLEAIRLHEVTSFTAIAASWARMLEAVAADPRLGELPSLRRAYAMWQSASSTEVYDAWKARGVELLNNFGSTAFATWILIPRAGEPVPPASLGRPTPGYRVQAVEPDRDAVLPVDPGTAGRMAVRGPTGLTYWRRPDLQRRDVVEGWNLVDDLIRLEADGNVSYLGRTDFIISTAGYKVAPVEVEEVLAAHPAVREVAVVGAPDPVRQEIVTAFVALQPGQTGDDVLRRELQDLVKARLSPYKYPRRVEFIDALPRDPVGKVQPRVLKDLASRAVTAR
jgi:2-aminobenzoate-CoA ligase